MVVPPLNCRPPERCLPRALHATRVLFAVLGLLCGVWGAHVPSLKVHYGLDERSLAGVLLAAAVGTVLSLLVAGRAVGHWGTQRVAGASALALCALLASVLAHSSLLLLVLSVTLYGAAMSLLDVAINTEASSLESHLGRPVMSQLHGMFSVGGMAGAGVAALMLGWNWAPLAQLAGVSLVAALWALAAARYLPEVPTESLQTQAAERAVEATAELAVERFAQRTAVSQAEPADEPADESADEPAAKPAGVPAAQAQPATAVAHFAWPRGTLLVLGLLIFAGMTAEGVMYDWCVLYLKQELGLPQAQAALGYSAFSAAMAASRFGGDFLRQRYPERWLLRIGGGLAALAMAIVLLAAHPVVAWLGFVLVGAGLAPVAPVLYNAATRVPGVSPAAAIASVTSIGYSGFLIGPPLIGGLASATSLSLAMGVVVLAAAVLCWGARWVPVKA